MFRIFLYTCVADMQYHAVVYIFWGRLTVKISQIKSLLIICALAPIKVDIEICNAILIYITYLSATSKMSVSSRHSIEILQPM